MRHRHPCDNSSRPRPDASAIARELADAWNSRDWARYRELLHSEHPYIGGDGQPQKGLEAGLAVSQMFATFPDAKIDAALAPLDQDLVCAAINQLNALKAHIGGLPDKKVSEDVSSDLLQYITNVQTFLVITSGVNRC